jgi:uncharacterized metal-binding protein
MSSVSKIKVVPCSGIGKVFGLMARETALAVTDRLCPDAAETVCLAHLVTGEDEALAKVKGLPCITVDGCATMCAAHSVEAAGGVLKQKCRVLDEMRNHKGKNAGTGTALTEDGWKIVDGYAEKIALLVKELEGANNG